MQQSDITKLLAVISTEYPRHFEVSKERIRLWSMILEHATYKEGSQAIVDILSEPRPFPPQVGEINQKILDNRIKNRAKQFRIAEETRLKALPAPEPEVYLDDESRNRCLTMLNQCLTEIAKKKVL